ncbi:MAG: acyl-CoA dehydrogenase family protein [Hyphomicrobiaceae bacterium]|nr:acyl-CoA dehydrogenase family protein [Hyphomicrobiaceae bacterium]
MALVLNEEQTMLRDSARNFLGSEAPVAHLRALRDARDAKGFSPALWQRCAEMGFAGVLVPEASGGLGLTLTDAVVIAEEIGRTLAPLPFLSSAVMGALTLSAAAGSPAAKHWLPQIAAGTAVVALAVDEMARHRPASIATKAAAQGGGLRIDGEKVLVLDGHVADLLIVAARSQSAPGGICLAAVDPKAAGVEIERTAMVDAHNAARVRLSGVEVGADGLIADGASGAALLEEVLDKARVVIAAMLLGAGEEAFQRTLTYLKERQQFGRRIGEFQALQHRASMLFCELELTRAAVLRAAQLCDEGADGKARAAAASVAKAKGCQSAGLAVQEGVQMHGGIGMTDAFEMGFFMKRVRVLQELLGDASFHEDRLATLSGY